MPFNHSQMPQGDIPPEMTVNRQRPKRGLLETPPPEQGTTTAPQQGMNLEDSNDAGMVPAQDQQGLLKQDETEQEGSGEESPDEDYKEGYEASDEDYQALLLQAQKLLFQQHFDKTFRYILTTKPEELPNTIATIITATVNRMEQDNGQLPDDTLLQLGVDILQDIAKSLAQLGVDVPPEYVQKSLAYAIVLWMKNHKDRLPEDLPQVIDEYMRQQGTNQQQNTEEQQTAGPTETAEPNPLGGAMSEGAKVGTGALNQDLGIK